MYQQGSSYLRMKHLASVDGKANRLTVSVDVMFDVTVPDGGCSHL
jgi:hypothetical protein